MPAYSFGLFALTLCVQLAKNLLGEYLTANFDFFRFPKNELTKSKVFVLWIRADLENSTPLASTPNKITHEILAPE